MKGVVYFNLGMKCLARLVVSLHSLREHYDGPVTILNGGGDNGLVNRIALDSRLRANVKEIEVAPLRRNTAYVAKSSLWRHSPYRLSLLLDSDTLVSGSPLPLFYFADEHGFVATRFSNWLTTTPIISNRLIRWGAIRCDGIDVGRLVNESLDAPHIAINTGVVAFRKDSPFLENWERLTRAGHKLPFTDELAAQILLRHSEHAIVTEQYNASPIYARCPMEERIIHHFHGGKHVTFAGGERGQQGYAIWWPKFQECVSGNVGGVCDWAPAGDERLGGHLVL